MILPVRFISIAIALLSTASAQAVSYLSCTNCIHFASDIFVTAGIPADITFVSGGCSLIPNVTQAGLPAWVAGPTNPSFCEESHFAGTAPAVEAGNRYTFSVNPMYPADLLTFSGTLYIRPSLTSLTPVSGTLVPGFSVAVNTYTMRVPYGTTSMSFTLATDKGTFTAQSLPISGNISPPVSLALGNNVLTVGVDANGTAGTLGNSYTITVTREAIDVMAPVNQNVAAGQAATFSVTANQGTPGYTYQWQYSTDGGATWSNVVGGSGATTASYTTAPATLAMNGTLYRCQVTDSAGTPNVVLSLAALLGVMATPTAPIPLASGLGLVLLTLLLGGVGVTVMRRKV